MKKTKLSLMLAASMLATAGTANANDVDWIIAPYLWVPTVQADVNNIPPDGGGTSGDANSILDSLVWGFMVHTQAQGENWGILNEITYADLETEKIKTLDIGDGSLGYTVNGDNQDWLIDFAVVWAPGDTKFVGFEPYAGFRYLDAEFDVEIIPNNVNFPTYSTSLSEGFTDFLIGAKYTVPLNEKWSLNFRGDYSFGDTDGSWLLAANAIYATKSGAWAFGYRYMGVELPVAGDTSVDLSLYGFQAGYAFKF